MKEIRQWLPFPAIILGVWLCGNLAAQMITGTILGTVTDSSGAVVPDAAVTITNEGTNAAVTTHTGGSGEYVIPMLPPGQYKVDIQKTGFRPVKKVNIPLNVDQKYRVDAQLALGSLTEAVEVSATAQVLQTDASDVSSTVTTRQLESLPNFSRNPMIYMATVPGIVPRDNAQNAGGVGAMNVDENGRAAYSNYSVNGSRPLASDILLDGAPDTDGPANAIGIMPGIDTLEEMKIITNAYSAEYGRASGAIVNFTTKSGTNAFHGSAFEGYQGQVLDANSFANNRIGVSNSDFTLNRFGGTFSGPVRIPKIYDGRNKTFFFFSYEGARLNQPQNGLYTVPTAAQRAGDFSQTVGYSNVNGQLQLVPTQIYLPFTDTTNIIQLPGGGVQLQRQQLQGAKIPANRMNTLGQGLVDVYPLPNRTGNPDGSANYILTDPNKVHNDQISGRLDQQITQQQRLFFRFSSDWTSNLPADILSKTKPVAESAVSENQFNPGATMGYTWTPGPKTVVDVRASVMRINLTAGAPTVDLASLGFSPEMIAAASTPVWPGVSIAGLPGQGVTWYSLRDNHTTDYSVSGSFTRILDKWTVKAGAEYRTFFNNFLQPGVSSYILTAQGGFTSQCSGSNCPVPTPDHIDGNAIAAAEMGLFDGPGFLAIKAPAMALRNSYYGFYSQNDWKVSRKLTLNLGLRWDLQPGLTDRYNRLTQMNFGADNGTGTPGLYEFSGVNGVPRTNVNTDYGNWGPRLGAAYRFNDRLVIRGGYAISYDQITGVGSGADGFGTDGFSVENYNVIRPTTGPAAGMDIMATPFLNSMTSNNAFPNLANLDPNQWVGRGVKASDRNNSPVPRIQMWNVTLEDRLPGDFLVSAAYVASRGTRLTLQQFNLDGQNSIDPAVLSAARATYVSTGTNPLNVQVKNPYYQFNTDNNSITGATTVSQGQLDLPYPAYNGINGLSLRVGQSWYNALQLSVRRSFGHAFEFGANYVWSKNEDDGNAYTVNGPNSSNATAAGQYPLDQLSKDRALSVSDTPQRATIYFTSELPFGKGKAFLQSTPVLSQLFGGWKASAIVTFQSGFPLNIGGADGSFGRPDLVGDPVLPSKDQVVGDGKTPITLPDGTSIVVPLGYKLYFNPHAYKGELLTIPASGGGTQVVSNIDWFGSAPRMSNFFGPGTDYTNLSLSRDIAFGETKRLTIRADAMNVFNHNMFPVSAIDRSFGSTQVIGTQAGYSASSTFGMINLNSSPAINPRNITLGARFQF
jgi:hypothetical protein